MNRFAFIVFFLAFLLASSIAAGQTYFERVKDDQVIDFFKHAEITRGRIHRIMFRIEGWDENDWMDWLLMSNPLKRDHVPDSLRKYFPGFTPSQWQWAVDSLKTEDWNPAHHPRAKWLTENDMEKYSTRIARGKMNYWSFSVPLFNAAGNAAIVKTGFHCGNLCAEWGVKLFLRDEKGRWKEVAGWNGMAA